MTDSEIAERLRYWKTLGDPDVDAHLQHVWNVGKKETENISAKSLLVACKDEVNTHSGGCTGHDMTDSAHNGCKRCLLRLRALEAVTEDDWPIIQQYEMGKFCTSYGRNNNYARYERVHFDIFACMDETKEEELAAEYNDTSARRHLQDITIRKFPSGYTGSQRALDFVRKKLHVCVENHTECGGEHLRTLPTRVIDVREYPRIRLFESGGLVGKYAALSHCWGNEGIVKTTSSTYAIFTQSIPWEILSKTFQEAIDFCRKLSIPFIWIDSLCIIQDSPSDWHAESGTMKEVYSNAFLTVAASASQDGREGCYRTQEYRCQRIARILDGNSYVDLFASRVWPHVNESDC